MTMDEGPSSYLEKVERLCEAAVTPHAFNLLHQITVSSRKSDAIAAELDRLVPAYLAFVSALDGFSYDDLTLGAAGATAALESYIGVAMSTGNAVFRSQSDFRTSIVPEFFLRILRGFVEARGYPFVVTGQADIPIDIAFDLKREGLIVPRLQRVDIAVVRGVDLKAGDTPLNGFCIPLVAAEAKNYFDKNMISGVEFSVGTLKSTFPHCMYFAISEFADFDLSAHSYAASDIDEIYILRKQKRSEFRKSGVARPICPGLICEILERFFSTIAEHLTVHRNLNIRVPDGRLIRGNPAL